MAQSVRPPTPEAKNSPAAVLLAVTKKYGNNTMLSMKTLLLLLPFFF